MKQIFLITLLLFISLTSCREAINNNNPVTPTNEPPNVPSNPTPANNATNVNRFVTLQWTGGDPNPADTVKYDIYMGNSNPPTHLLYNGITNTIVDIGLVAGASEFYWRITAYDNHNMYSEGPVWKFTTQN